MTEIHTSLSDQPLFQRLLPQSRAFLDEQAAAYRLTVQECRQACEIALDLQMWGAQSIQDIWPGQQGQNKGYDRASKKQLMSTLRQTWEAQKKTVNIYPEASAASKTSAASQPFAVQKQSLGLGRCPVASPRTLCCNLQTLDAVDNCGYGCSYCSIQSFFDGKQISFDKNFAQKLKALKLDPDRTYHIGTGQSSDSLMFGNSHGVLDAVIEFAHDNPNVLLELKTKSANVSHLLRSDAPKNILCTWSLNTPTIIQHEEHGTATLEKRLGAARRVADAGFVVGFHFHPIIHYQQWEQDYVAVVKQLDQMFSADEVALVSMGTLTFIKSVMREIRNKALPSQILKMPLVDADGKQSYPDDIKLQLFKTVYAAFSDSWKAQVFYYLCMENQRFWKPVFGYDYASNVEFEMAMKNSYKKNVAERLNKSKGY